MDGLNEGDGFGRANVLPVERQEAVCFGFAEDARLARGLGSVEGPPAGVGDVVIVGPACEPREPLAAVGLAGAHGAVAELADPERERLRGGEQRSELAVKGGGDFVVALVSV